MFHISSRVLPKMLAGMASTCCLMKRTVPVSSFLKPLYRSLAVQSPRFFVNNQETSRPFKDIGKSNALEIGPTRFTLNIMASNKEIVLSISESNKETRQHKRHIWLSMTAAKTLLERVETNRLSTIVGSLADSCMDLHIIKFEDTVRQETIELKLVKDRIEDVYLKILVQSLVEDKGSAILVPLGGVAFFQEKLANMIRNYEKLIDPNRSKVFEELLQKEGKKRDIIIPIKAAQALFVLLKDACEFIQSHERRISMKQPHEVVHEKSFADQVNEYTVQVQVSEPEMRHLGDMILAIKSQRLDNELNQELVAWKAEAEAALAELQPQNWMGSEEDRQKEFPKQKEKFAKKLEEIYKKYSNLV